MFVPRLYHPYPIECGVTITFDKERSHYLMTVLRLKENDPLILFNGQGGEYHARIAKDKKKLFAKVYSFKAVEQRSFLPIHLGQGLARGDRMDMVIQKATELGTESITPLFTKRSCVKLEGYRCEKRLSHWQNIAISATEQCHRTELPTIFAPMTLTQWVLKPFEGTSILLAPSSSSSLKMISSPKAIRLAIGPESGWDEEEITLMKDHQFIPVTLGPRILRTETASIAAISIIQGMFGDLCQGA